MRLLVVLFLLMSAVPITALTVGVSPAKVQLTTEGRGTLLLLNENAQALRFSIATTAHAEPFEGIIDPQSKTAIQILSEKDAEMIISFFPQVQTPLGEIATKLNIHLSAQQPNISQKIIISLITFIAVLAVFGLIYLLLQAFDS